MASGSERRNVGDCRRKAKGHENGKEKRVERNGDWYREECVYTWRIGGLG